MLHRWGNERDWGNFPTTLYAKKCLVSRGLRGPSPIPKITARLGALPPPTILVLNLLFELIDFPLPTSSACIAMMTLHCYMVNEIFLIFGHSAS